MTHGSSWLWLSMVLVGWVFLGLVAGRFNAARNQLSDPAGGGEERGGAKR